MLQAIVRIARCFESASVACLRVIPPVAHLLEAVPHTLIPERSWKAGKVCIQGTVRSKSNVYGAALAYSR